VEDLGIGAEIVRGAFVGEVPIVEDVHPLGEGHRRGEVLLDNDQRLPLGGKAAAHAHELPHDERGEAFEGLVQQNDLRGADQRATEGKHLLFPA